jgi:hypothetical protein
LSDLNIITDRGSNLIKAFAQYEPVYCFDHRINNVLKVGFFSAVKKEEKKHTHLLTDDILAGTNSTLTTVDFLFEKETFIKFL